MSASLNRNKHISAILVSSLFIFGIAYNHVVINRHVVQEMFNKHIVVRACNVSVFTHKFAVIIERRGTETSKANTVQNVAST